MNAREKIKGVANHQIGVLFLLILIPASLLFFLYTTAFYLDITHQAILGWGFLALLWILKKIRIFEEPPARVFYLMLGAFVALRYWMFRTLDSLVFMGAWDVIGMLLLYIAETYGIFIYFTGMFVSIWPMKRSAPPLPSDPGLLPTVDIFIPTYSEPEGIVKITALACTQIDYPKDKLAIYILDDGASRKRRQDPNQEKAFAAWKRYHDLRSFAEAHGMVYLTREDNTHAKAGNINAALDFGDQVADPETGAKVKRLQRAQVLGRTSVTGVGELVFFLDCDHAPSKDFLTNTVGYFLQDPKLFLVQTPHFFINPTPVEKNLGTFQQSPGENEMFYGAIQPGLDFWNSSFFCGSAALLRRKYLKEIGGIQRNSITEDAETSLALHARGYNSVYVSKPMTCGLSPETFGDFIVQRSRWTQGMIQIFMLRNPLGIRGLTLAQRLCYANSCLFWFFGLARVIFFAAPLLYLYFGIRVYNASAIQVLAYAVPHIIAQLIVSDFLYGRVRHPFFSELYESVQSLFLAPSIIASALNPRAPRFKVTPKGKSHESDFLSPLAGPFYLLFFLSIGAMAAGAWRWSTHPDEYFSILICLVWLTFNFILVMLCLGIVWESPQRRRQHRIWAEGPIRLAFPGRDHPLAGELLDVSMGGVSVRCAQMIPEARDMRVEIGGVDGYGQAYSFQARIARVQKEEDGFILGLEFIVLDPETLARIVGFVYGDSNRWERFWELRQGNRISVPRGLYDLLRKGIRGTARNFHGTLPLAGKTLLQYGKGIWSYLPWQPVKTKIDG